MPRPFPALALLALLGAALIAPAQAPAQSVPDSRAEIALSFAPVVRRASPAVVSIYAQRVVQDRRNPLFDDPLFGQLFGDRGRGVPRVQNALGSGVILSEDGYVVSNHHVVGGARDIRVVLSDRREFQADLVLEDPESDLAVLRLRGASGLPALDLADSDAVEVGDLVLAIGNPFGVGQTVSSGIVSALARSGLATGSGQGYFIQTDAAINPGNSGGALVDMQGRLLGINTAILTRSGGSNGIGFAIPANLVGQVLAQAEAGARRFQRPWTGAGAQPVDSAMAEAFGMALPQGVILSSLHSASPLARAGLRPGDVIVSVDGAPVNSAQELQFRLSARGIGGEALLDVLDEGTTRQVAVALIAPPEDPPRDRFEQRDWLLRGLVAETLNPAVASEAGLDASLQGVFVVEARDMAARAGLAQGDVILAMNGYRLVTTRDLRHVLREASRWWEIDILRDGRQTRLRFRI